ncbi:MAG: hypothetical protein KGL39_33735 [Patescibacteria group bacterium]|nr:hypothetical protein [Patescibacteria group bacterium]
MTIALIVLGVVAVAAIVSAVAVGVVLTRARGQSDAQWASFMVALDHQHGQAEAAWVSERRELVNRVQAPQYVPRGPVTEFVVPELEPDGINEVGTIQQLDDEQLAAYLSEEVI